MLYRSLIVGLIALTASMTARADHLDEKIRAVTLNYPPYEYQEDGIAKGLAVEILEEAVKRANEPGVNIRFFPWKRAVREIEFGNAQVIFNAGMNEARKKWGRYSEHVLIEQKYYLFQRKGDGYETDPALSNIADRRIAIRRGYLYGSGAFKQAILNERFATIYETDSSASSIKLLLSGRVDMFIGDLIPVMHYIKEQGLQNKITLVRNRENGDNLVILTWPTYFLFSKKNINADFVDHFDAIYQEMIDDGTYQKLVERYLPKID